MHVEEAEAQPLQFGVKLRAQFRHDFPLRQPRRDHVVGVGERRAQHRLRHNRQRQRRDNLQRRPARRRLPAERIHRRRQRRVERVADDVNHHAQQLEAHDAEQQQHHAQHQRPQAIRAKPPRQRQQPANEFRGGIPFVGGRHCWLSRTFSELPKCRRRRESAIECNWRNQDVDKFTHRSCGAAVTAAGWGSVPLPGPAFLLIQAARRRSNSQARTPALHPRRVGTGTVRECAHRGADTTSRGSEHFWFPPGNYSGMMTQQHWRPHPDSPA